MKITKKNNYASPRIRAGTRRTRSCRGAAGSQGAGAVAGFCFLPFVPLPFWLYILRFFRFFRFFSISLSAARHFWKIGGKFAPCWACASNQAEQIAKKNKQGDALPVVYRCLRFVFLSVYIPRHRLDKKTYTHNIIIYPPMSHTTRRILRAACMRYNYIWAVYIFCSCRSNNIRPPGFLSTRAHNAG